ncbi:MAG: hypothetical protein U0169_23600 [Polyangiaceae bacterium]
MIVWPTDSKLTPIAKSNLDRFKATAAAKALEDDAETWHFVNWSWLKDPPIRFTLSNERHRAVTFTLGSTGHYTMHEADLESRIGKAAEPLD